MYYLMIFSFKIISEKKKQTNLMLTVLTFHEPSRLAVAYRFAAGQYSTCEKKTKAEFNICNILDINRPWEIVCSTFKTSYKPHWIMYLNPLILYTFHILLSLFMCRHQSGMFFEEISNPETVNSSYFAF